MYNAIFPFDSIPFVIYKANKGVRNKLQNEITS